MDQPKVDIIKNVLYSDSLYFLHSRKCFFYTHPLEDSYIVHDNIGAFCLFLLQKDFGTFHKHFFKAFLCCFDNSYLSFLYIGKKL